MPKSPAFSEFEAPRRAAVNLPKDVSDALLRVVRPGGAAPRTDPRPDPVPAREPYFEIYRADRVSLTSILFSGGDWLALLRGIGRADCDQRRLCQRAGMHDRSRFPSQRGRDCQRANGSAALTRRIAW